MTETDLIEMVRGWREGHHDLRFGQWVWAVVGGDPFYIEDDDMAERIRRWFEENEVDLKPQGPRQGTMGLDAGSGD